MDSRSFFPRPRGRSRKGQYWDTRTGSWIKAATSNSYGYADSRTLIQKHYKSMHSNSNVTTLRIDIEADEMRKAEEENERRFMEESSRLQEIQERKNAEERAMQEADAKRHAEESAKRMRFMQPHNTAFELYEQSNRQIPIYWLDSHGNFYQCPAKPYSKVDSSQRERPFIWKTKIVDKVITYKDDPITLAKGEWEYRCVSVQYKSYV